jgi:hypothetical protein
MRTLAQNDDLLNLRDLLHEAEGEAAERMQQIARSAYAHTERMVGKPSLTGLWKGSPSSNRCSDHAKTSTNSLATYSRNISAAVSA